MKFALAFMMLNEVEWLKLHLPVILQSTAIDGVVVIDGGSTDGSVQYVESLGGKVIHRAWDWKPLDQENAVVQTAEWMGYDAILLTAPDEVWFPEHIDQIKDMLASGQHTALAFNTFNFQQDRWHYAPYSPYYPDTHTRAWLLGQGFRRAGAIDSTVVIPPGLTTFLPHVHLYHYVGLKDRRFYAWKGLNFHRVKDGLPPLDTSWQECAPAPYPPMIAFSGPQPIKPEVTEPLERLNAI